jgi:hypothetical protein
MIFILFSAAGAIYVVIIVFVQETFNSVTKDLGLLAVFLGVDSSVAHADTKNTKKITTVFFINL